jgi:hypothetical protein
MGITVTVLRPIAVRGGVLTFVCLCLLVGCGSRSKAHESSLTAASVESAFGGQGIQLVAFSGSGQLVSSAPPTVEVEILKSDAAAKAVSAPQQVNGTEVAPIGTRNVLVWVDPHASTPFQQRVSAALAALDGQ